MASWFGNEPSSSKYIGTISSGRPGRCALVPNTDGAVRPPIPLAASMTIFSGRIEDKSTSFLR